jgi:hypothetical protein
MCGSLPVFTALSVVPGFQYNQAKPANIDFVPVGQRRRLHPLPVDVGAVEATDVDHMQRCCTIGH